MKNKKILTALLCAAAVFALASCGGNNEPGGETPPVETTSYVVSFNANGGSSVTSQEIEEGQKATKPTDPTREGYTFGGWYKEAACTNAWNFATDTVTANTTLYAKWTIKSYSFAFDAQGGSEVAGLTVEHGKAATKPADPTKAGYSFDGWYKEAACENVYDFTTEVVKANVTVYAKWSINTYTVTFNSQRGSEVAAATVNHDALVTKPADPTRTGYNFGGWYKEAECTNAWNFETDKVTAATTLYAKWDLASYAVTFDVQGGSAVEAQNINYGGVVVAPTAPTKVGYTFGGWYKEAECTNAWDFTKDAVVAATTLYAKWTLNVYVVTFDTQDGQAVTTANVNHGELAVAPTAPTRTGYTFGGWFTEVDCTNEWVFAEDAVTSTTTLYAKWTKNVYEVTFMNGTAEFDVQEVEYREVATAPQGIPTQTAKVFIGWFADEACTEEFDFTDLITEATTVYAGYRDMTTFERLSAYNTVISDDFNSYTAETVIPSFHSVDNPYEWDAQHGLSQLINKTGGDATTNYVKFDGQTAELFDSSDASGTQLIVDFEEDIFNGVAEVYFEYTPVNGGTGHTAVQFVDEACGEFFGIRIDKIDGSGQYFQYRIDGGSATAENQVAMSNATVYKFHIVFDLSDKTVTATINDVAIATDVAITAETIKGIKFVSGDSNTKSLALDNLAVANEQLAVAEYQEEAKAVLEEAYAGLLESVTMNILELDEVYEEAYTNIEAATTNAEARAALLAGVAALEEVLTDAEQVEANAKAAFEARVAEVINEEIPGYKATEIAALDATEDAYYIEQIESAKEAALVYAEAMEFNYDTYQEDGVAGEAKLAEMKATIDQLLTWSAMTIEQIREEFIAQLDEYVDQVVVEYDTDNHVTTSDKANLSDDIYAAQNVGIAAINAAADPNAVGAAYEEAIAAVDALIVILKAREFTVAYVDTNLPSDTVVWGSTLEMPENPTKEDAYFVGWYTDIALSTPLTGEVVVKNNVRLFAKWYDAKNENNLVKKGFGLDADGKSTITTEQFTTYDDEIISLHLTKGEAQKKQGSYYPLYMGGKTSKSHYIEIDLTSVPSNVDVTITVSVLATHTDRGAFVATEMSNAFPTGTNGVDYICPTTADKSIATMTKVVSGGEVWYVNTVGTIYICEVFVSYGSVVSEVYTGFDTTNVKKTYVGGSALSLDTTGLALTVLDGANVAPEDGTVTATVDDAFTAGTPGKYEVSLSWGNHTVGTYKVEVKRPLVTAFETTAFGDAFTGVEQTNNAAGPMVTVIGWVKSIASTKYGNMYIEDAEGNEIYIYGTYQGGTRYDSLDVDKKPQVGDVVVLYGQASYYNGYQIKNAEIYQLNTEVLYFPPVDVEISEILAGQYDSTLVNVTGIVSNIKTAWTEKYGNMDVYITDAEGNSLFLFRLATQVEVGQVITATGNVTTYEGNYQLAQGCTAEIATSGVKVGANSYATLAEAVEAAEAGDQIILVEDVEVETAIVVNKDLTIHLNGKTISCPNDTVGDGVFHVTSGATLTINGEGTINGTGNNDYNMAIWADGGHVVINGGTYTNEDVVVEGKADPTHFDLIYVKNDGTVTINGGTFKCVTPKWTLNSHNTLVGTITVNGGSFYQFDPSNYETDDTQTSLGAGYVSTLDGKYYVVGEPAVEGEIDPVTVAFSDTNNRTIGTCENDANMHTWVVNGITLVQKKGTSSTAVNDNYYNPIRLYVGHEITISAENAISKVVFTTADSKNWTEATTIEGATITIDGTTATVEFATPVTSFTFKPSVQIRVQQMEVHFANA